jgi:hypothetical protein
MSHSDLNDATQDIERTILIRDLSAIVSTVLEFGVV